jgi:hypothetical protein
MKLTAIFKGKLPEGLFLNFKYLKLVAPIEITTEVSPYEVAITLIPCPQMSRAEIDRKAGHTFIAFDTVVSISGEVEYYFKKSKKDNRNRIVEYYLDKEYDYSNTALKALNNMISYFKYELNNPISTGIVVLEEFFWDKKWYDESGNLLMPFLDSEPHYKLSPLLKVKTLGAKPLKIGNVGDVASYISKPRPITLYQELLAEARAAVINGGLKRAILEMAIATEVIVKGFYFGKGMLSGNVYEYLESKRKIEVSVTELLDGAARYAIGASFKDQNKNDFINICNLFQARNKVAHQAECYYRDKNGKICYVTFDDISEWWTSIQKLVMWIEKLPLETSYTANKLPKETTIGLLKENFFRANDENI